MAINFNSFTTGTVGGANPIQSDDFVVGFDTAVPSGERKWPITTLANAISGVMNDELIHKINQNSGDGTVTSVTGTAPISVANGTSTPAISIAAATTSAVGVAELATLAEVQTGVGTNTIVTPETLNTLLQTLSTNIMNNLGNYPYLEYAWVTAPNAAGQSISANTITTLTLNTEVADLGNFGSVSGNQITLAAGTYRYSTNTTACTNAQIIDDNLFGFIMSLYNETAGAYICRTSDSYDRTNTGSSTNSVKVSVEMEGQFVLGVTSLLTLRGISSFNAIIQSSVNPAFSNSTANADQRTTIKLWKVG